MSKMRTYQKAWSQALKGDFSLVDQIYHPEYRSFDFSSQWDQQYSPEVIGYSQESLEGEGSKSS